MEAINIKNIIKKISFSRLIFSLIFSVALFYMNKIVFLGTVSDENYMDLVFLKEFLILIIIVPIVYFISYIIEKNYKKITDFLVLNKEYKNTKKFCIIAFIFLLVVYLIYFFSLYPGGVYIDTWTCLKMLTGEEEFSSQQPVLYTLFLNLVLAISNVSNLYLGFGIFTLIQVILMVSVLIYFINWLLKKKVNPLVVGAITVFFAIFKLYPLYSVSIWKDTPFSLALFMYTLHTINILEDLKNEKIKTSHIVAFNIFALLVIFLRNNGIYLVFATFALLVLFFIKKFFKKNCIKNKLGFLISSFLVIIISLIIQFNFSTFGIEDSPEVEKYAIPIQQVARVVAVDGNITDEQKELIEKIMPLEEISKSYRALIVDKIKWHGDFDNDYFEEHLSEYYKLWFELLLQNPGEYFRAYLLETCGFWSLNVYGDEAYDSATTWETLSEEVLNEILNKDLISEVSNFSFKTNLVSHSYYSPALFFWIMFLSILITFRICKNKKSLIGFAPAFLLWLTVMIATPMGLALRYVYILVLILPLCLVYPAIIKKQENIN